MGEKYEKGAKKKQKSAKRAEIVPKMHEKLAKIFEIAPKKPTKSQETRHDTVTLSYPSVSCALMFAPLCRHARATLMYPLHAARCSGVAPSTASFASMLHTAVSAKITYK